MSMHQLLLDIIVAYCMYINIDNKKSNLLMVKSSQATNCELFETGAKLAPFGWRGERVHCPAVM